MKTYGQTVEDVIEKLKLYLPKCPPESSEDTKKLFRENAVNAAKAVLSVLPVDFVEEGSDRECENHFTKLRKKAYESLTSNDELVRELAKGYIVLFNSRPVIMIKKESK